MNKLILVLLVGCSLPHCAAASDPGPPDSGSQSDTRAITDAADAVVATDAPTDASTATADTTDVAPMTDVSVDAPNDVPADAAPMRPRCAGSSTLVLADANADGRADAICHDPSTGATTVALSDGAQFGPSRTWLPNFCHAGSVFGAADFDGDQRADLFCHDPTIASTDVALSNGSSFGAPTTWLPHWCGTGSVFGAGDFNGDGRADVFCHEPDTTITSVALSTATAFAATGSWLRHWCGAGSEFGVGDFNGDGRTDVFCHEPDTTITSVALSNGASAFAPAGTWLPHWCGAGSVFGAGDFDGDGRTDVYCHEPDTQLTSVALSDGTRALNPAGVWRSNWCGAGAQTGVGDVNVDHRSDVFCRESATGRTTVAQSSGSALGEPTLWLE